MFKKNIVLLISLLFLLPGGLFSHEGDHSDMYLLYKDAGMPIGEEQARTFAHFMIEKLVEKEKINKTWLEAKISKVTQKKFANELEWVVSYSNPKEKDESKKTLFIFLSQYGKVLGANFTGK